MAWTPTEYVAQFDALAGDVASLASTAEKILWFNDGQTRLLRMKQKRGVVAFTAAQTSVALPVDFVSLDKLVMENGSDWQEFRVFGNPPFLHTDDTDGFSGAGNVIVYYNAYWVDIASVGPVSSELPRRLDYAVLHFTLSRFFNKLAANRMYFKRYATLVGSNAVTANDLVGEADRYYQLFLDARDDDVPQAPALFFDGP